MEPLNCTPEQMSVIVKEILRFLDHADDTKKRSLHAASDWERGVEDGQALAWEAAAMRLGEMTGLVTQGMVEDLQDEVTKLRERAETAVV